MELYGGGMVYPANNYQLGGLIARSRREREYQGEMRELREQAEKDAEKRAKYGRLGSLGSFVTNLFLPGAGGVTRSLIESRYDPKSFKGGKYGKKTREELGEASKAFKKGVFERGLVDVAQSLIMPEVYEKAGETLKSGLRKVAGQGAGWLKGLGSGSGTVDATGLESGLGIAGTAVPPMATKSITPYQGLSYGSDVPLPAGVIEMPGDTAEAFYEMYRGDPTQMGWGGPETEDWKKFYEESVGFSPFSSGGYAGGGLINYMMPRRMQTGGYATATGPLQALEQMGFEGIADDERLQDYLEDLPDWQQGYAQQVGDITTAGQQQMGQIGAQMRQLQASSGFGGSGIGAGAAQQARTGVGQEFQRGRRGIVEGFQGDLLTGIRDIETKGEFEFGEQEQTTLTCAQQGMQTCPDGSCAPWDGFCGTGAGDCEPPAGGCADGEVWNQNTCTCVWAP
jgi:hypothetical protein